MLILLILIIVVLGKIMIFLGSWMGFMYIYDYREECINGFRVLIIFNFF